MTYLSRLAVTSAAPSHAPASATIAQAAQLLLPDLERGRRIDADMTPLQRLLLPLIFQTQRDGDGWYFFAEECPDEVVTAPRLCAGIPCSPSPSKARSNRCKKFMSITRNCAADAEAYDQILTLSTASTEVGRYRPAPGFNFHGESRPERGST